MAKVIECDNCGVTARQDDFDALMWWVTLGWSRDDPNHACSVACAKKLLKRMDATRLAILAAAEQEEDK